MLLRCGGASLSCIGTSRNMIRSFVRNAENPPMAGPIPIVIGVIVAAVKGAATAKGVAVAAGAAKAVASSVATKGTVAVVAKSVGAKAAGGAVGKIAATKAVAAVAESKVVVEATATLGLDFSAGKLGLAVATKVSGDLSPGAVAAAQALARRGASNLPADRPWTRAYPYRAEGVCAMSRRLDGKDR